MGVSLGGRVSRWACLSVGVSRWVCFSVGVFLGGCVSRWVCLSVGVSLGGCIFQWVYLSVCVLIGTSLIDASSVGVSPVGACSVLVFRYLTAAIRSRRFCS
jgi:hypothetical protein